MVTREMSESNENVEKDVTLNAETAPVEKVAETVENKPTEIEEPVAVDNQVEEQQVTNDAPVTEPAEPQHEAQAGPGAASGRSGCKARAPAPPSSPDTAAS